MDYGEGIGYNGGMSEQREYPYADDEGNVYLSAHIWISPKRCGGQPCLVGHRIPVPALLELMNLNGIEYARLCYDATEEQLDGMLEWYGMTRESVERTHAQVLIAQSGEG